jgi:hypothetical protein
MGLGSFHRRLARACLALFASLVLAVTLTPLAPAAAATVGGTTDVTGLPKGPAPHAAYLRNGVIHRRDGSTLTVTVAAKMRSHLQLLGRTPAGWAVVRGGEDLLLVRPSRVRRIARVAEWGPFGNTWYLARNRRRVLVATDEDQAGLRYTVFGLDGRRPGSNFFPNYPAVLDFTGPRVVLAGSTTRVWTVSGGFRTVTRRAATLARWTDDVLFVGRTTTGPTSLHHPGTAGWTTRRVPIDLSPSGRRVLTVTDPYRAGIQRYAVLSMSDGRVLSSWRQPYRPGTTTAWEGDHAVLLGMDVTRGQTVLRCRVHGTCSRTLAWSVRASQVQIPITFPMRYPGYAYY